MSNNPMPGPKRMLLMCLFVVMLASPALTQSPQGKEISGMPAPAAAPPAVPHPAAVPSIATSVTNGHQATMLLRLWGIDDVHVRSTASGSLIRFSYRVVDTDKAKILNDKKATPYLFDQKNGLALQIPRLENVGQLRQVATPENGREYWMAFSNSGRNVKPGNHVTVVIGNFKAEELVVEDSAPRRPH
jgi:hypothetical protein